METFNLPMWRATASEWKEHGHGVHSAAVLDTALDEVERLAGELEAAKGRLAAAEKERDYLQKQETGAELVLDLGNDCGDMGVATAAAKLWKERDDLKVKLAEVERSTTELVDRLTRERDEKAILGADRHTLAMAYRDEARTCKREHEALRAKLAATEAQAAAMREALELACGVLYREAAKGHYPTAERALRAARAAMATDSGTPLLRELEALRHLGGLLREWICDDHNQDAEKAATLHDRSAAALARLSEAIDMRPTFASVRATTPAAASEERPGGKLAEVKARIDNLRLHVAHEESVADEIEDRSYAQGRRDAFKDSLLHLDSPSYTTRVVQAKKDES